MSPERSYRLEVLPEDEWAVTVASWLAVRLKERPGLRVCLPTGDTPSPVYAELVAKEWRGELVDQLTGPLGRFVAIDVDGPDPEAAAAAHDAVVAEGLDLAVLGLGMNGHVGFNEPGSRPDDGTRLVRLAVSSREAATTRYGAGSVPTAGITVGLARLLEASEVWLLVTGERKAGILRVALEGPESPDCPASFLRRHPRLTVFADEAAASLLTS